MHGQPLGGDSRRHERSDEDRGRYQCPAHDASVRGCPVARAVQRTSGCPRFASPSFLTSRHPRTLERFLASTADGVRDEDLAKRVALPKQLAAVFEAIVARVKDDPDTAGKLEALVAQLMK